MIEVHHLCKHYGNQNAVDDISFTIEKGHVYGLLGANGAGKSTTMNILTGCLAASSGDVKIGRFDIFEESWKAKKLIGYLPENPPLYQEMTVQEYLFFVAEAKEVKKGDRHTQVEHVMEETGITDVAGRMIRHLSKGYRQRVGIAQALLGNPEVIILDEPTVGLDPRQIIEIRQLIRELGKNHTVILSSHILSEVRSVCDQILIISKGHLVAGDTPENLEKLFAGNTTIELTARAEDEEIRQLLSSVRGIRTISCSTPQPGKNGESETEVSIQTDGNVDIREDIFDAFAAVLLPFAGIYTMAICLQSGYSNFEYVLGNIGFIFLSIVPILTMRTFAEEKKQKTDQLLYSLPTGMLRIVIGKYLALLLVWRLKRRQKKEKEQSFSDDDIYNDSMICDIWNSYKGTPQATAFLLQKNGIVLKYNDGGKKMAVFRIEKNKNYTTMSNYHLRDRRLSLKAKGLLSLILSLPDGWDYSVRGLASICKESPDGIATPLKELEKYGYLFREQTRCSNGRLGKVEYVIYEQPQDNSPEQELPCPEKPYTVKPDTVKSDTVIPLTERPCTGTPSQINKEEINTEKEITDKNNYQSNQSGKKADADKMMMERNLFKNQIKKNISYGTLAEESPAAAEEVDELVELMSDAVCVNEPFVRVGGSEIPTEVVRERFLRLNSEHILYVMGCLKEGSGKIHNIHQYLLTALYNAPVTMNHYYTAEVNHDLRGG